MREEVSSAMLRVVLSELAVQCNSMEAGGFWRERVVLYSCMLIDDRRPVGTSWLVSGRIGAMLSYLP